MATFMIVALEVWGQVQTTGRVLGAWQRALPYFDNDSQGASPVWSTGILGIFKAWGGV